MKKKGHPFLRTQTLIQKSKELSEESTNVHRRLCEHATELQKVADTARLPVEEALTRVNGVHSYAPTKLREVIRIVNQKKRVGNDG
jgi:hypothetical protein